MSNERARSGAFVAAPHRKARGAAGVYLLHAASSSLDILTSATASIMRINLKTTIDAILGSVMLRLH
jgi:hypothetical protein